MSLTTRVPPSTGWMLPDDACAVLARLVEQHQPELIVEAGSGRSTVVLAEALDRLGRGRVVALEHDPGYFAATSWMLVESGLAGYADVRLARLEPHGREGLLADHWYARAGWDDLDGVGMLVVDGPPGGGSRYARGPALPLLRDRMRPGAVIVLDDINRESERTIWRDWHIVGTTVVHAKASLVYGRLP